MPSNLLLPETTIPWRLVCPEPIADPQASIDSEAALLRAVGQRKLPPTVALVRHPQALVATRREARMAGFEAAREVLATEGWPLAVRASGGSCVPQGAGMLNLALVFPRPKNWTLEAGYRLLCTLLQRFLAELGIASETGEVPGSFCDGRYNLQTSGRKLVGTAQRWAGGDRSQAAILLHACLLVDLDLAQATAALNRLYALCNNPQRFDPAATTSLRDLLDPARKEASFVRRIEEHLTDFLEKQFNPSR